MTKIPDSLHLQGARCTALTDINGLATTLLKAPTDRVVDGGLGWFDTFNHGDSMLVDIVDHDNLMGGGIDTIVGYYYDMEMSEANKGWYVPDGGLRIKPMADFGNLPAGMYIRIRGQLATPLAGVQMYCNIIWGKRL